MPLVQESLLRCAALTYALLGRVDVDRVLVCADVASQALLAGVDPALTVAVAWQESKFTNPQPNAWGCAGPMQIKVRYHCADASGEWSPTDAGGVLEGCDLVAAGVRALRYYVSRASDDRDALCRYGWGRCDTPHRQRYVRETLRVRDVARRYLWRASR